MSKLSEDPTTHAIFDRTVQVMFMSVPHIGIDLSGWAFVLDRIATLARNSRVFAPSNWEGLGKNSRDPT